MMSGDEANFQNYMNEGHSAAWDGLWEQSAVFYRQALAEMPNHPKALTSLGLALFELGKYDESLGYYLQAEGVSPGDPLPVEKTAQIYELLGDIDEASLASLKAADSYISRRDVDKAIENLLRVTKLDPENKVAHSRLALIHERLGHKPQAVVEYLALAGLMQHEGEPEKAIQAVNRALQILPTSVEAHQALSLLREKKSLPIPTPSPDLVKLAPLLREDQLISPIEPVGDTLENNPVVETSQKAKSVLAELILESDSEDGPNQSEIRGLQGLVRNASEGLFHKQTDLIAIKKHLSQAINYQTQEQTKEAITELSRAISAGLDNPAAYFNLGLLLTHVGEFEDAISMLMKVLTYRDYALGSHLLIGQSLYKLERYSQAAIEYLEALRLADSYVVSSQDAAKLKELYEPLIESETNITDEDAKKRLCENIDELLMEPGWRDRLSQIRDELPTSGKGGPPQPIGEILTEASSSEVVDAIASIHQLAKDGHVRSAMEGAFFALRFAPTYLPLHIYMGELLLQQEQIQSAIAKFTIVAQTYSARGESLQAIEMYRRIIDLAPMDLISRSRLIEELKKVDQTDQVIKEYLKLADVHYNLADLGNARKTYTDALRFNQQSYQDKKLSNQILHKIADIDVQSLDWRQALKVYEQIKLMQPDDRVARNRLVELNFKLGQESQALNEMDNYLSRLLTNHRYDDAVNYLETLLQDNLQQKMIQYRLIELYKQADLKNEGIKFLDSLGEKLMQTGDRAAVINIVEMILALEPPNADKYEVFLDKMRR